MNALFRAWKRPWSVIGTLCVLGGGYATILRFTKGLGAATNLSDAFPWGLWVGFDVITGVGLAAGGFTISALVYILHIDRFKPLARPAILTAFLGYLLVVGGLIFDLGLPWRIWHPMIMWNPHSVMFEVAWCVTLYTLVLTAETSTLVFEKFRWARATKIAHRAAFPLTVAAVLLSMQHQSSLGSLFLLVPGRLHEYWYTPLLPLLFFVSAVSTGLVMTIIESNLSTRVFRHDLSPRLLRLLARIAAVIMSLYLIIRFTDMARAGTIMHLHLDRPGILFLLEISLGFVIPIVLFSWDRVLQNRKWLYHTAQLALLGFIINRLNVSISGFEIISGKTYVPAWTEIAVTLMIITLGVTAFKLMVHYFPVFDEDRLREDRARSWKLEIGRQAAFGPIPQPLMETAKGRMG